MSVIFKPEKHEYISLDPNENIQWTSVTSFVGKYKMPFDKVGVATKVSKSKKSKWYGMTVDEILEAWKHQADNAIDRGNWYHNQREADLLMLDSISREGKELPVVNPIQDDDGKVAPFQKLQDGVYPEHFVYLKSVGLCGQSDLVTVLDGKINILDYKGLALDTEIPTPSGFILMKDVKKGDVIFDGDGKPTTIKNVSSIHYNPCYKITFDNHDSIVCDHEHKWVISKRKTLSKYSEKEMTTDELYNSFLNKEPLKIKCVTIETEKKDLPIDPYVLGVWLGDGSKATGIVTNMNEKIWREIENRGYSLGDDVSKGGCGKAQLKTIYGLRSELKELNLLNNKHIPDIYLRASFNQRLDLLRGFMDTDGYFNRKRNRCVARTTSLWQANAIKEIVSSLGWKATVIKTTASGFNKKNIPCYDTTFKAVDHNPFLNKNEDYLEVCTKPTSYAKFRTIKNIEVVDTVPTKCIEVESSTHCYLATRYYIKTHNTNKEIKTESYVNWEGKSQKMLGPVSHLDDCNYNHYALQLSTYMYIMLKHNPKFKPGKLILHHVLFFEEGLDHLGAPIIARDINGEPIIKKIVPYEVPYLKEEVVNLIKDKQNAN
jgi:hypothetical protein